MSTETEEEQAHREALEKARGKKIKVAPADEPEEESDWADGSTLSGSLAPRSKAYTFVLTYGKTRFFCVEAGDGVYNRFAQGAQANQNETVATQRKLAEVQRQLQVLEAPDSEAEDFDAALAEYEAAQDGLMAEAQVLGEKIVELARYDLEASRMVVESCVRAWANPTWKPVPPCNTEAKAQLSPSRATDLAQAILERGLKGRHAARFPQ